MKRYRIDGKYKVECPRCDGTGIIDQICFKDRNGHWTTMGIDDEVCHVCCGNGKVWTFVEGTFIVESFWDKILRKMKRNRREKKCYKPGAK